MGGVSNTDGTFGGEGGTTHTAESSAANNSRSAVTLLFVGVPGRCAVAASPAGLQLAPISDIGTVAALIVSSLL